MYFSVTNDHVLKALNFSCLSQKIVSKTLIKRLRAILTPFLESTQFFLLVTKKFSLEPSLRDVFSKNGALKCGGLNPPPPVLFALKSSKMIVSSNPSKWSENISLDCFFFKKIHFVCLPFILWGSLSVS